MFRKYAKGDIQMGADLAKTGDLSAVSLVATADELRGLALAMLAGARAIEVSPRFVGSSYVRDPFGECGDPQEIAYYHAAESLRVHGERMLSMLGEV